MNAHASRHPLPHLLKCVYTISPVSITNSQSFCESLSSSRTDVNHRLPIFRAISSLAITLKFLGNFLCLYRVSSLSSRFVQYHFIFLQLMSHPFFKRGELFNKRWTKTHQSSRLSPRLVTLFNYYSFSVHL